MLGRKEGGRKPGEHEAGPPVLLPHSLCAFHRGQLDRRKLDALAPHLRMGKEGGWMDGWVGG